MKRAIYPLFAAADAAKVQPILDALKAKGVSVRDAKEPAGREDALVLFLSENVSAEGPEAEAFFRLNADRALVIPVNLDGSAPPEELQSALMARHSLDGAKYTAGELADRIARAAKGDEKSRLPLILSVAAAAILLIAGGIVLWRNRPAQPVEAPAVEATATPRPTATPTAEPHVDGIGTDLSLVAEVVYVGDVFKYYQMFDGYYMGGTKPDNVRGFSEVAYDVWDDGPSFYSKETGQEIPMAELGDVSYLKYLPNLMYLTFVNVKGELPDLSMLHGVRQITIINCEIPDIEGLRGCGISGFEYHGRTVKDFSPLNDCADLHYANIAPWGDPAGADLSGFHPANLDTLSVNGAVDDLGGLLECRRLKDLYLGNARVTDLSFLQGLELTSLCLDSLDRITDLAGLGGMTTLQKLEIQGCRRLRDVSALEGCSSLSSVNFNSGMGGYEYLKDVSVLGKLPRLRDIGLYGVNTPDLNFLQELKIKSGIRLGFCINGDTDYSGLAAIDSYSYLHVNTCGNYAAAAPYLADKTVRQLMIYDGGLVDLSTLPNVTGELDLCQCRNRDLTGIRELGLGGKLWIQDCPYFTSFDGIENLPNIGKAGSTLTVENCPRLTDWSGIEGKQFDRIEIERVMTLPDFGSVTFSELTLEKLSEDVLPDLSCLDGISDSRSYSFRLEDLPQITSLAPLFRLHGNDLAVPPQVGEQAQGLVDDGRFKTWEIVYPDGSWDPRSMSVQLLSLEELDTLPPSILKHVKELTIIGDYLVNDDTTNVWTDWSQDPPVTVLTDRASGEELARIDGPGTLFTDFSRLSVLTGLNDLNLWYQPLTDLEGIQALEDLRWLKVEFCPQLTDVSAAFTMQGLKGINFERCPVSSLQGIQNLYDLERLEVCNTGITSLEGIEGLKHLTCVRLAGTDVKDFSPIAQVDFTYAVENRGGVHLGLNVMNSRSLPEDAFDFLASVPAFDCFEINDVPIQYWLDHVADKPIKMLWASNCGITQEQFSALVEAHPELEEVHIPWNDQVTDASPLLKLEDLRYVKLSNNMQKAIASLGDGLGFELYID